MAEKKPGTLQKSAHAKVRAVLIVPSALIVVLALASGVVAGCKATSLLEDVKARAEEAVTNAAGPIGSVATPAFTPSAGTYTSDQSVTVTSATEGASIRYTISDGTTGTAPTESSTEYTAAIPISGDGTTKTIEAIAVKEGMSSSQVAVATYVIKYDQIAKPTILPSTGSYSSDQNVVIECSTQGATIHYTVADGATGSTPTADSPVYTAAIPVTGHGTVKTVRAIAVKPGMADSEIVSVTITINYNQVSTPQFSPAGPTTLTSVTNVAISDATAGATIYCAHTTDGSIPNDPDPSNPASYTSFGAAPYSVQVSGTGTIWNIKAIAAKPGLTSSTVASSGAFTVSYPQAAVPTFDHDGGTYSTPVAVSISTSSSGASIRYTTDGSTPTTTHGDIYAGTPVAISSTGTVLQAIAYGGPWSASGVKSATYVLQPAAPSFDKTTGTYTSSVTVTISESTPGTTVRYTTDNSQPTSTHGTVYSSPVTLSTSVVLKAVAYASGSLDSSTTSASFTIVAATPTFSPGAGTYTTDKSITISCATPSVVIRYTTDGSAPNASSAVYGSPIPVAHDGTTKTIRAYASKTGVTSSTTASATYSISYDVTIYVAGYTHHTTDQATLWQGKVPSLTGSLLFDKGAASHAWSVFLYGSSIYLSGEDYDTTISDMRARFWKYTPTMSSGLLAGSSTAASIFVNNVGTQYMAGYNAASGKTTACYWIGTGSAINLTDDGTNPSKAFSVYADGTTVHTAGWYNNGTKQIACRWVGTSKTDLPGGTGTTAAANSITVSGGTVYTAGSYHDGTKSVACYWAGTTRHDLPGDGAHYAEAASISIDGSNVYVGGYYNDGSKNIPCYWVNGQRVDLAGDGVNSAMVSSIHAVSGSVYMAGTYLTYVSGNAVYVPCIWRGTTRTDLALPTGGTYALALSIAVK